MLATILRQKMKKIRWLAEITKQNVIVLHFVESKANVKLLRYSYPRDNRNKTLPTYILHTPNNPWIISFFTWKKEKQIKQFPALFLKRHIKWTKKHTSHIRWNTADKSTFKWIKKKLKENEEKCIALIPRHIFVNMVVFIKSRTTIIHTNTPPHDITNRNLVRHLYCQIIDDASFKQEQITNVKIPAFFSLYVRTKKTAYVVANRNFVGVFSKYEPNYSETNVIKIKYNNYRLCTKFKCNITMTT